MGSSSSKEQLQLNIEDRDAFEPDEIEAFKNTYITGGISKLKSKIDEDINRWKHVPINIAVAGNSGVGKSSFINSFRGLKANSKGAAAVNADDTTQIPRKYLHPDSTNIALWDLPVVGTYGSSRRAFLKQVEFEKYDYLIMITAGNFTENDLWLAREVTRLEKTVFFLRSKLDLDVANNKIDQADLSENDTIEIIHAKMMTQLQQGGFMKARTFLINNHSTLDYDFPLLIKAMTEEAPKWKQEAMTLTMTNLTEGIIMKKKETLKKRVFIVSLGSEMPLPGLVTDSDFNIILREISAYKELLNLDEKSLERSAKLAGTTADHLKAHLHLTNYLVEPSVESVQTFCETTDITAVAQLVHSQAYGMFGSIIGNSLNYGRTVAILMVILDSFISDALTVNKILIERLTAGYIDATEEKHLPLKFRRTVTENENLRHIIRQHEITQAELQKELDDDRRKRTKLIKENEEVEALNKTLVEKIRHIVTKNENLEDIIKKNKITDAELQKKLDDEKQTHTKLKKEKEEVEAMNKILVEKLQYSVTKNENLEDIIRQNKVTHVEHQKELDDERQTYMKVMKEKEEVEDMNKIHMKNIRSLKDSNELLKNELKMTRIENETEKNINRDTLQEKLEINKQLLEKLEKINQAHVKEYEKHNIELMKYERRMKSYVDKLTEKEKQIQDLSLTINRQESCTRKRLKEIEMLKSKKIMQVQLLCERSGELTTAIMDSFTYCIRGRMNTEHLEAEIVQCMKATEIQPAEPLLFVCVNSHGRSSNVALTLKGLDVGPKLAVVIIHVKEHHALPQEASDRVLVDVMQNYPSLGGMYDIAFMPDKGMYKCEMNDTNFVSIANFINRVGVKKPAMLME